MKLDRNIGGTGKYAVLKMRKVTELLDTPGENQEVLARVLKTLETLGVIEYGEPHSREEFFVLKLKDRYSREALLTYSYYAHFTEPEYAEDVKALADRAGYRNRYCKDPD